MKQFHVRWTFRNGMNNSLIQVDEYGFKKYMVTRYKSIITQCNISTAEITTTHQHFLDCLFRKVSVRVLEERK